MIVASSTGWVHDVRLRHPEGQRGGSVRLLVGLALVGAAIVLWIALRQPIILAGCALLMTVLIVAPPLRCRALRLLKACVLRWSWRTAVAVTGLQTRDDRAPRIRRVTWVSAGERLLVQMPAGVPVAVLEREAEAVAGCLRVRGVRVERSPDNARHAVVTVVRRDPLLNAASPVWPLANSSVVSLWEPVPVALDEAGQPVYVRLPERNVLVGGEPGAGKSNAMALLLAAGALDPEVRLHLLDGKLVELAPWSLSAQCSVGPSPPDAIDALRELQAVMEDTYAELLRDGRRKVERSDGRQLHLVVVDELAFYLSGGEDRKTRVEFAERLRDLVSRGRAAGIIVVAATQKPSADVIPTHLRDLFGFRWALRCSTPQASDTVLGSGWASSGYTASTIDAAQRGVGYLLTEGAQPRRCRAYHLDDDSVRALAAEAHRRRSTRRGAGVTS